MGPSFIRKTNHTWSYHRGPEGGYVSVLQSEEARMVNMGEKWGRYTHYIDDGVVAVRWSGYVEYMAAAPEDYDEYAWDSYAEYSMIYWTVITWRVTISCVFQYIKDERALNVVLLCLLLVYCNTGSIAVYRPNGGPRCCWPSAPSDCSLPYRELSCASGSPRTTHTRYGRRFWATPLLWSWCHVLVMCLVCVLLFVWCRPLGKVFKYTLRPCSRAICRNRPFWGACPGRSPCTSTCCWQGQTCCPILWLSQQCYFFGPIGSPCSSCKYIFRDRIDWSQ